MLGGMMVWAAHFGGVYAIASVFDVVSEADAPASRWISVAWTGVCLLADVCLLLTIRRLGRRSPGDEIDGWVRSVGMLGASFSLVAVLWQGLPNVVGH
jgi:hypothetical protein